MGLSLVWYRHLQSLECVFHSFFHFWPSDYIYEVNQTIADGLYGVLLLQLAELNNPTPQAPPAGCGSATSAFGSSTPSVGTGETSFGVVLHYHIQLN